MFSEEQVDACFEAAAANLKAMTYEQLEDYADTHGTWYVWKDRDFRFDGETINVSTLMGRLGRTKKGQRVTVEISLDAEEGVLPRRSRCVYFERYKSGRLYDAEASEWEIAVFRSIPYLFLLFTAIGLLALAWNLLMRSG